MPFKSAERDFSGGDVVDDNRQNQNEIRQGKTAVNLVKQDLQANDEIRLTDNVIKAKPAQKTAICEYSKCGKEFVQTVSWKRFCCDDHRKFNWESIHGKKLHLK